MTADRFLRDDTAWSEPGETAGKPDRWQSRTLHGCFLTAGANGRKADGSYVRPESETPWTVCADVPDADRPGATKFTEVRMGTAASQAVARLAAEAATVRYVLGLDVPPTEADQRLIAAFMTPARSK